MDGLNNDPDAQQQEQKPVHKARQNLEAGKAECTVHICWATRQRIADIGKHKAARIGQHVGCICQQCERARDQAANNLCEHKGEGDERRYTDFALRILTTRMGVAVLRMFMQVQIAHSGVIAQYSGGENIKIIIFSVCYTV